MKKTLPFVFAITLAAISQPVLAHFPTQQGEFGTFSIVTCGFEGAPKCDLCELLHTGQHVLAALVYAGVIASLIFILVGAVTIMISGGNEATFAKGKGTLVSAVVGLIIVLAAWLIVDTILNFLANPSGFPLPWYRISC